MKRFLGTILLTAAVSSSALAQNVIVNGGFEVGGLAGWTVQDQAGSSGSFFLASGTLSPLNGFPTAGPNSGSFFAMTDQGGPGAHALSQSFNIAAAPTSAILTFHLSINNQAGGENVNTSLDYMVLPSQYGTVDLFSGLAIGLSTGVPLSNFFASGLPLGTANPWVMYTADITSLLQTPGDYTLRFAEVDNLGFFGMGVDDVSLEVTATPEPGTIALLATGLVGMAGVARRRRKVEPIA